MAGLQRAYVHDHHRRYDSAGFLFQGRFKSQPIQKERYLLACGRYIEQNPVNAGLVTTAETYAHSSARCYVDGQWDDLTAPDPLYEMFGSNIEERAASYRAFLAQPADHDKPFEEGNVPVGDEIFVSKLILHRGRLVARRRGGLRPTRKEVATNS